MAEIALRQIRAVIAVCEEGSFTRAAVRENSTQSGISQHVAAVEQSFGIKLFERSASGVKPTPAGWRYYKRCIDAVSQIASANDEVRAFASRVSGDLRVGLIPTVTRAVLAPALDTFVRRYPDVRMHIVEGYSATLTEMVQNDDLDFAVVPATEGRVGLKTRLIARDREMLVSNVSRGLKPFAPIRLKDCGPLKMLLPSRANVRRRNMEVYFETHGIEVEAVIEMDAMISTMQFVRLTDWVTILSGMICYADIGRDMGRVISPIEDPPLIAEFVVISPARRMLSTQGSLFLQIFEEEIAQIQEVWAQTIPPAVYPVRRRATSRGKIR
jgi:LysR family transcriptional regulator, nitrogen assimilation regulatory protein